MVLLVFSVLLGGEEIVSREEIEKQLAWILFF
jgi:hypothetical protein